MAKSLLHDGDSATPRTRNYFVKRIIVRWRSMKDRFNKDMRQENQVKSGAAHRILRKYKYHRNLAFLRPALATRTIWCSTTQPGSSSVGVDPHRPANEQTPSQSSTNEGATWQAS
ncbi:uncharacterized protein LOC143764789 [Ranitomeya variabilis]|uniref:uncharacterized protein LOC143764789 n=1 Tax=Ranitomeya variabilis TaxID=490064 RepID=UPI00405609AC